MMTKTLLDAQTTVELPAREMLGVFNFAFVGAGQQNNSQQLNLIGALQLNASGQSNGQGVLIVQS